ITADDGQVLGVDVVRPDDAPRAPPPMARTPTLALFLRSDAPGALTPTWQLALVQSLADLLARAPGPSPAWLAPLSDPRPR
ncbi:MAG: hypothetical protein NDI82_11955, partial [Anaeromyxobacteraceae bacterium]|nr:hypothetical protein [Anaeromyxobacteraceae bacterium]